MLLGARQFFERRCAPTPPLPFDAEVEYVETDGVGSYIDTGVVPALYGDVQSTVQVKFSIRTIKTYASLFAARHGTSAAAVCFSSMMLVTGSNDRVQFARPGLSVQSPLQPVDTAIHDVSITNGMFVVDGVSLPVSQITSGQVPINPFMLGCSGSPELWSFTHTQYTPSNVRFYSCKIVTGGVTVFDGIPVRKGGQGFLYDYVSGNMFGNAGADGTSVTYGPDKS